MKRKILFIVLCSFLLTGVVSAASLWGNYKGNAIIKVKVDGSDYKTTGVPPISYNGQVLIPLSALNKLGVAYTYDSKKMTANIIKPYQTSSADVAATRESPISWMKLYYTISSDYKALNDITLQLNTHFRYLGSIFYDILEGRDPKTDITTATNSYNYLSSRHKQLESIIKNNISWAKDNGIDVDDLNEAHKIIGEALAHYEKAQKALDSYQRMRENKNYMDDYFYNIDMGSTATGEASKIVQAGYNKIDQLIMAYK